MNVNAVDGCMEIREVFPNKEHTVLATVRLPDVGPGGEYILDRVGEWLDRNRPDLKFYLDDPDGHGYAIAILTVNSADSIIGTTRSWLNRN